jgi:hypothetical protein
MTPRVARLARALRRPRRVSRLVTRIDLRDAFRVWQALNALDTCITAHRAAGDTAVRIVLEFEQRKDGER